MATNSEYITDSGKRDTDKLKDTTTTASCKDKSGSSQSDSDKVQQRSSSLVKRKPFTSRDSFEIETKYVVLSFMKNVPKDVEERTWTPVSSTPSSETGQILEKSRKILKQWHRKYKCSSKDKDTIDGFRKQTNDTSDIGQSRFDSGSSSSQSFHKGDSNGFDQRLEFEPQPFKNNFEQVENITSQEDDKSSQNGNTPDETTGFPGSLSSPCYHRTISTGSSSRGDGSVVTDADDELGSSSSHSSIKLEIDEPYINQGNLGSVIEHDIAIDRLPPESGIFENDSNHYLHVSRLQDAGETDEQGFNDRQKHPSSTQTIVPMTNDDLPSSLDDFQYEELLVFSDSSKPERTSLHLDLAVCHASNIVDSLSAVLVQNSSDLDSEVNNAVEQGQITPSEQTRVSSLASPETQVARYLVSIADRVEAQYGHQLQIAVENAFCLETNTIPYELFQTAFSDAMGHSLTGVTQVALCLMYSQRLTFAMLQSGHNKVNYLLEYAARLVADKAADFIINQGGWSLLAETDIDTSSLNLSIGSGDSSRVPSPTKQDRPMAAIPETSASTSKNILPQNETSSDELSEESKEQNTEQRSQYSSFINPVFRRLSYVGFSFSIVAAVAIVGVAIVLSKH